MNFVKISESNRNISNYSRYFALAIYYAIFNTKELYFIIIIVENIGFEPMTPCVQGRCSSQLS